MFTKKYTLEDLREMIQLAKKSNCLQCQIELGDMKFGCMFGPEQIPFQDVPMELPPLMSDKLTPELEKELKEDAERSLVRQFNLYKAPKKDPEDQMKDDLFDVSEDTRSAC